MIESIKLKLSELPDDEQITYEYANTTYTVAELKREILELYEPHHLRFGWKIAAPSTWVPSASGMIEDLIENARDDMYEGWIEKARDCLDDGAIEAIQRQLEEMFEGAREYWTYGKDVEIDITPDDGLPF